MARILIVTSSDEPNVRRVVDYLPQERVFRIDTDTLLGESFSFQTDGWPPRWKLAVGGETISCEEIGAVWYRRPASPKASPELSKEHRLFAENEAQRFLRSLWSTLPRSGILWMNHPSVLHEIEFNKPYQAQAAQRVGLPVPETLITNDPRSAEEFFERCGGEVAVKTFGGYALTNEEGYPQTIYTNRVSREILERHRQEIGYAPVMFQSYIPKRVELRITAVGKQLFSCAIHSQDSERTKDDWRRYDFNKVLHESYQLPPDIQRRLLDLLDELDITFGAIDMILTPEGEHVFLEVNPSGQWGWIERLTGMPITRAIAETLASV